MADSFTKMPNWIFDLLPELSSSELRVLMVILRQTAGWQRDSARIGYRQFQAAGIANRQRVKLAIESLIKRDIIERTPSDGHDQAFNYRMKTGYKSEPVTKVNRLHFVTGTGYKSEPEPVTKVNHIKEKRKKKDDGDGARDIWRAYGEVWGAAINPTISADVETAVSTYGRDAVLGAIRTAGLNGARSWAYAKRILKNGSNAQPAPPTNGNRRSAIAAEIINLASSGANWRDIPAEIKAEIKKVAPTWRDVKMMSPADIRIAYLSATKTEAAA